MLLYLNNGGYISAVEYRVGCNEQPTKLPSDWSQPQQVVALCRFPETAEPLRQTATPGDHSNFLILIAYVNAPNQDSGLSLHPGCTVWNLENAVLYHMSTMSFNLDDAFGSAKQVAQLQQSSHILYRYWLHLELRTSILQMQHQQ